MNRIYYYMWRDKPTAKLIIDDEKQSMSYEYYTDNLHVLPFGGKPKPTYKDWAHLLERRCFPRTRDNIETILRHNGIKYYSVPDILSITNGLQYEDYGWIKPDGASLDYNLIAIRDTDNDTNVRMTPMFLRGNQFKSFGGDEVFKGDYIGYEGMVETIASRIASEIYFPYGYVEYNPCMTRISDRSKSFTTGCYSRSFLKDGYIEYTLMRLFRHLFDKDLDGEILNLAYTGKASMKRCIQAIIETIESLPGLEEFGKYMTALFEFDRLILNDDRHLNNITVYYNEHTNRFTYAKLFDCGSGLLANNYQYPTDEDESKFIDKVKARPFFDSFDKQYEVFKEMYGGGLIIPKTIVIPVYDLYKFYDKPLVNRVLSVLKQQFAKYYPDTTVDFIKKDLSY